MRLIDGLKRQVRTVIEWEKQAEDVLFYQWSADLDEIKNASKLIIGPGQGCIFVYEGKVRSVHNQAGLYDLRTDNIPFFTTIQKFMQAFESEHKTALYFYRRTKVLDQKWGTTSSIKYIDPVYAFPVGLRSYGNFSFQIQDPLRFFTTVSGHGQKFSVTDFRSVMASRLTMRFSDHLAAKKLSYAEIDAARNELAADMMALLASDFSRLGFLITDFRIEGIDYDTETKALIDRVGTVTADVYAADRAGLKYEELQRLHALHAAANNEGGAAGIGVGMGAGIGMGQIMGQGLETRQDRPEQGIEIRLHALKDLFDKGLITEAEYSSKKQEILQQL